MNNRYEYLLKKLAEAGAEEPSSSPGLKATKYGVKAFDFLTDVPGKILPKFIPRETGEEAIKTIGKPYEATIGRLDLRKNLGKLLGGTEESDYDPVVEPFGIRTKINTEAALYSLAATLAIFGLTKGKGKGASRLLNRLTGGRFFKGGPAKHRVLRTLLGGTSRLKGGKLDYGTLRKLVKGGLKGEQAVSAARRLGLSSLPAVYTWRAGKRYIEDKDRPHRQESPEMARARSAGWAQNLEGFLKSRKALMDQNKTMQAIFDEAARLNPARAALVGGALGGTLGLAIPEKNKIIWSLLGSATGAASPYAIKYIAQKLRKQAGMLEDAQSFAGQQGEKLKSLWESGKIQKQLSPEALSGHLSSALKAAGTGGRLAGEYIKKHPYEIGGIAASAAGTGALIKGLSSDKPGQLPWTLGGTALHGLGALLYLKAAQRRGAKPAKPTVEEIRRHSAGQGRKFKGEHAYLGTAVETLPLLLKTLGSSKQYSRDDINQMLWIASVYKDDPARMKGELSKYLLGSGLKSEDINKAMSMADWDIGSMTDAAVDVISEIEEYKKNPPKQATRQELLRNMYKNLEPDKREAFHKAFPGFK